MKLLLFIIFLVSLQWNKIQTASNFKLDSRFTDETRNFVIKQLLGSIGNEELETLDGTREKFKKDAEIANKLYESMVPHVFSSVKQTNLDILNPKNGVSIPVGIFVPNNYAEGKPIINFIHGGGYIFGSTSEYRGMITYLAYHTGAAVVSVDYRLAPEHKFPSGLDDAKFIVEYILENKARLSSMFAKAPVGVMGDSAGGNFASVIANELGPKLDFQILIYGALSNCVQTASATEFGLNGQYLLPYDRTNLDDEFAETYGISDPKNSRYNSLLGVTSKTAKSLMVVAELDPLRDDSTVLMKAKYEEFNVSYKLRVVKGTVHGFIGLPMYLPKAFGEAMSHVKEFLKDYK